MMMMEEEGGRKRGILGKHLHVSSADVVAFSASLSLSSALHCYTTRSSLDSTTTRENITTREPPDKLLECGQPAIQPFPPNTCKVVVV